MITLRNQEVTEDVLWSLQPREEEKGSATLQKPCGRRETFEDRSGNYKH